MRSAFWASCLTLALVTVVLAVACGGSDEETDYALPGPFDVGVTFLELADGRAVDVWYPGSESGQIADPFVFNLNDAWPTAIQALVPEVPNTVVDAYPDIAASGAGPFPVILESHGLGSTRLDGAQNHRQLASWGFIVVAPEHVERNRATLTGQPQDIDELESADVLLAALDLVVQESLRQGSILEGRVDDARVAVDGVSAGGEAALELASDSRIGAVIARAPAGPATLDGRAPVLLIASDRDVAVDVEEVRAIYDEAAPPKALAVVLNGGHNTFTDSCAQIRAEGGIDVDAISEATGFPRDLVEWGNNGCTEEYVDPATVWPLISYLQVAHIRWALGIDGSDEMLQPDVIETEFPGLLTEYARETAE